jgi:tetrahydromethanopterin S-methyltransferase subunit F
MDKTPYWILEAMWYLYILIMTPKVLYDATVQDGFAGFLIGLLVTGVLLLIPQILKGK